MKYKYKTKVYLLIGMTKVTIYDKKSFFESEILDSILQLSWISEKFYFPIFMVRWDEKHEKTKINE